MANLKRQLWLFLVWGLMATISAGCAARQPVAPAAPPPSAAGAPAGMPAPAVPQGHTTKVAVGSGSYTDVDPAGLEAMLRTKNFPLINVHIPYQGELDKTDAFIPYDQIRNQLGKLPADKDARVVLYCRSGRMSQMAAEDLVKLGYKDVWNLEGGMIAWQAAGYQVLQKPQ